MRFGDGEFGRIPERSEDEGNFFRVTYRVGPGARANVARDTVVDLDGPDGTGRNLPDFVESITNPLAVTDGEDPHGLGGRGRGDGEQQEGGGGRAKRGSARVGSVHGDHP